MKYVIKESALDKVIKRYLDEMFPEDELSGFHPDSYDEDLDLVREDKHHLIFCLGDYDGENDAFHWYDCDYFYDDAPQNINQTCPVIVLYHPYDDSLIALFDDSWEEVFKVWFKNRFGLPVKTVEFQRIRN
jgi:hypothetical protein